MVEAESIPNKSQNLTRPYKKSNSIATDIKYFFINKPANDSLIRFDSESDRIRYNQLIYNRTGIDVEKYNMLNIHQIGIDTPVDYLFAELMKWNSDSCWWPNHIAKVHVLDNDLSRINVFLFGKINFSLRNKNQLPDFHLLRLFNFKLIKKEENLSPDDNDNIHYLLYECSGGYPIGVFSLFARKSNPENNEKYQSQLFMMVSFNFYGIKTLSKVKLLRNSWEAIHNRVTSNALTRIKAYCEERYRRSRV